MQCFTPTECSEWLRQRDIAEAPRGVPVWQFGLPKEAGRIIAFTRSLFLAFGDFPGGLLVFTDWALYRPDEMALIDSLRRRHGERRPLIEAPGHVFTPAEVSEATGQSYLPIIFAWSAYMYLASGLATVYFWEGDLVDFWTSDSGATKKVEDVAKQYGLRVTGNDGG